MPYSVIHEDYEDCCITKSGGVLSKPLGIRLGKLDTSAENII